MTRPRTKKSRRKPTAITVVASGCDRRLQALIRRAARAALYAEGVRSARLDVAVVDGREMARLHRQWMGENDATDVLTFDLKSRKVKTSKNQNIDAQIVACETVARRRATAGRRDWRDELLLYVVHGCLHLCGYDDRRASAAARMHRREDAILIEMGRGAVFYAS